MKLAFTDLGWQDYLWFQENAPKLLKRLNELIKDAKREPFKGLGKPEPLKGELAGHWSRLAVSMTSIGWCIACLLQNSSLFPVGIIIISKTRKVEFNAENHPWQRLLLTRLTRLSKFDCSLSPGRGY
jgi:Txe/YoeB family toxin of toxin-antitoxin system